MMIDTPSCIPPRNGNFTFLTEQQLADLPPVEYLIDNGLPARGLSILFGPWDVGKTFLAIDWACSVDKGVDWAGRACKRGPVLYIAAEGAEGMEVRSRTDAKLTSAHCSAVKAEVDVKLGKRCQSFALRD
jgi:hypothetical protein